MLLNTIKNNQITKSEKLKEVKNFIAQGADIKDGEALNLAVSQEEFETAKLLAVSGAYCNGEVLSSLIKEELDYFIPSLSQMKKIVHEV